MPRKETSEKRPSKDASSSTWCGYWSRHPKEHAEFQAKNKAREEKARLRRLTKHKPEVFDIQSNGKYLRVEFRRENGEVWLADYELSKFFERPGVWEREISRAIARADRYAAVDGAQGSRPPAPADKPRS